MTLSSLVVSRDWPEVSVLECILGGLHIGVDVEPEPERARVKLAKSKIDALIVDSDLDGSASFLRGLESHQMKNSVPLVIISGSSNHHPLKDTPATFFFRKPISVEQAVRTLSAARNMILDGRLRYHRHTLDLPVTLSSGQRKCIDAHLLNLSQGGIAVRLHHLTSLKNSVQIAFRLPGMARSLKLQGEVSWKDEQGNIGIQFVKMTDGVKRKLQLWLEQQYLKQ